MTNIEDRQAKPNMWMAGVENHGGRGGVVQLSDEWVQGENYSTVTIVTTPYPAFGSY